MMLPRLVLVLSFLVVTIDAADDNRVANSLSLVVWGESHGVRRKVEPFLGVHGVGMRTTIDVKKGEVTSGWNVCI